MGALAARDTRAGVHEVSAVPRPTRSSSLGAGPDWAATLLTAVAVFCGTGLEQGGPLTPSLIVDCASGSATAFFLCLLPVRPMPLVLRGIGTCHRAVCGAEQA